MVLSPTPALVHRRLCGVVLAVATLGSAGTAAQQPPRFSDRVNVARIIVDARVLDDRGNPVLGLTAGDFKVEIDGKAARVESATWIGGLNTSEALPLTYAPPSGSPRSISAGRLVVFLFQKDLEPSRIPGLMRMLLKSHDFLDTLTPNDRVAILSFDSHLKVWTDFTNDRETLDRVLVRGVLFGGARALEAPGGPSLIDRLEVARARRTYSMERALELIADALEPLPGSKSLVLIGHGFGRLRDSGVAMEDEYGAARRALVASRTSVFSLDVTEADYHSLEAGLQLVSRHTGGFYARTHVFPGAALRRLSGALAGYYVLFVEEPEKRRTGHSVRVELTRRGAHVLASSRQ